MEKFCYRCGALEEEKGPLVEGLCRDCFLDENPLIRAPDEIELEICDVVGLTSSKMIGTMLKGFWARSISRQRKSLRCRR